MACDIDTSAIPFRGELLTNEPMSLHTSLKTGGAAEIYAIPVDEDDLMSLLAWLHQEKFPWMTIGRGYNLLVGDGGILGAVISLQHFNRINRSGELLIEAEAGADNLAVVRYGQQFGLGGIGFLSGIPGSIGGAIRMNAGAYGEGILGRTQRLTLLRKGAIRTFHMDELEYGYRFLTLERGDVILAATFRLELRDPAVTEEEIRKDLELRRTKHNVGLPSAGSFFKNPNGQAAWKLIDAAGMRGVRVGGAQVSHQHSNFLVNAGGATTRDFLDLAEMVKNAVFTTSGVTLEEEVRIVGKI